MSKGKFLVEAYKSYDTAKVYNFGDAVDIILKNKRSKINLSEYQYLCKCIYNNLIKLEIWDKDFFHIYLSNDSKKEVSTNDIVSLLMKKNKKVIVPKICHDQLIVHFFLKNLRLLILL